VSKNSEKYAKEMQARAIRDEAKKVLADLVYFDNQSDEYPRLVQKMEFYLDEFFRLVR